MLSEQLLHTLLIVCPLVFLGGLVDAVAGGGGLITLPAYLLAGLPPHAASATNKCGNVWGTLLATYRFLKRGEVHLSSAVCGGVGALIGAWAGVKLNMIMPERYLYYLMLIIVPVMAVFLLFKREFGTEDHSHELSPRRLLILSLGIGLVMGCYDGDLETILWRQIKFQITGKLKEAFPDATWDFVKEPPLSQILDGEPLRIRTRNTGSYNFAEILMDARGSLMLQMMTIESLHKKEPSEGNPDSRPAVNPKSWYSLIGKPLLMELVGDLQARGYEKLFINEQGDVYILNGTEPEVRGKLEHFPPKDYWGELTEIFTEDELTTEETEQALELSWIS